MFNPEIAVDSGFAYQALDFNTAPNMAHRNIIISNANCSGISPITVGATQAQELVRSLPMTRMIG